MVARGDQQKTYLAKEEVHRPTVNTMSVFLTAVIEASEVRDTWVHDVSNAFVQTENNKKVVVKIK